MPRRPDTVVGPHIEGDRHGGKVVIDFKYDWAFGFKEGLSEVRLGEKSGYIDKTGKMVISPKYDKTDGFKNGVARVKLDGKFGFINRHGKEVIKPVHDYISNLTNNM